MLFDRSFTNSPFDNPIDQGAFAEVGLFLLLGIPQVLTGRPHIDRVLVKVHDQIGLRIEHSLPGGNEVTRRLVM